MHDLQSDKRHYVDLTFENIKLQDCSIANKQFDNCTFIACDFTKTTFANCQFCECTFKESQLSLLKIPRTRFVETHFAACKMLGINWTDALWSSIKLSCPLTFYACDVSHASFFSLYLPELLLTECKAHAVDFREADLSQADFSATDFTESQFVHTNLTKANFTAAINYSIDIYTNKIKQAKFSFPDAVALLASLEIDLVDFD